MVAYCFAEKDGKEIKKPTPVKTISISGKFKSVILKTSNGCGIGNFLIPSTGDSGLNSPPMLGIITYNFPNYDYTVLDTVPGKQIKGVAFTRSWWPANTSIISASLPVEPYVVVSDTGLFSYRFDGDLSPYQGDIYELDSIFIPGILKMATQITTDTTNPIILLVEDTITNYRIKVISYPGLLDQFSFPFYFEPEIFEITENALFITGWDTTGTYTLYHFSATQDTLFATYTLNDSASNAKEFLKSGDTLFVLSSPGDSITVLTNLYVSSGTFSQNIIYPQSGARATYNEYKNNKNFTFQPINPPLEEQILVFDPATGMFTDTLMINKCLDWFKHPDPAYSGFGYFSMEWIGARWENGINDSVFISETFGSNLINIEAGDFPKYINATFGCWVGIQENELEEINFEVHPNPASSETVISLTGLKKGRKYTFSISDMTGRVLYTTNLEAYQEIELPIQILTEGLYLLNLYTGRNNITRKLIIE